MVNQLAPHPIAALVLEQRRHHLFVTLHDARALRVVLRHRAEQLGHPGSHPPVAAAPEKGSVGSVIKQSVGLLQFVEVSRHFERRPVQIDRLARGPVGLYLQRGDHIHVINPEACLAAQPIGDGLGPLAVGGFLAQIQILLLPGLDVQLERDSAEDGGVHAARHRRHFRAGRSQDRIESLDEPGGQVLVAGELGECQSAIPRAGLRVNDGVGSHVRAGDEALGDALADLFRRLAGRPASECAVVGNTFAARRSKRQGNCEQAGRLEVFVHDLELRIKN